MSSRHGRDLTRRGEPEAVVPVGPGSRYELSGFGALQHGSKIVVLHECGHGLHIVVIADVHHLSHDPIWHGNRLVRCHPPDVLHARFVKKAGSGGVIVRSNRCLLVILRPESVIVNV